MALSALAFSSSSVAQTPPGKLLRPGDFSTSLRGWWKLEEASGNREDFSGNANHLAPVNGATRHAENYWSATGGSGQFAHASQQDLLISHASQNGLEITGPGARLTMAAWVRINSHPTYLRSVMYKNDTQGHTGYGMAVRSNGNLWLSLNDSDYYEAGNGEIMLGRWHHIAISADTTTNRAVYFVDGNVIAVRDDVTAEVLPCADGFRVGGDDNGVNWFDGQIHDAAVWARVLTPQEIKSLASGIDVSASYRPGNVSVAPTAWWKMNEISSGASAVARQDSVGAVHWTDMNTVTSAGGYLDGAAAEFRRANNEHLARSDSTVFDFSGGVWSVSTWVMPYDLANRQLLFEHVTSGTDFMAAYVEADGSLVMRVDRSGATVVLVSSAAGLVKRNTWQHCTFTENGNAWKIYLDGREVTSSGGTNADRAANYSGSIQLAQSGVLGGILDGRMADLAVWKGYALSAVEIKALATALTVQKAGVISYWPLDETNGTRSDAIGGNHLTPVNTPAATTGLIGNAADFESGSSQYLKITNAAQSGLNITSGLSVLGWVRPESTGSIQVLASRGYSSQGYNLSYRASGAAGFDTGPGSATSNSTVTAGAWSFLGGVWDEALRKVVFNGAVEVSGPGGAPAANTGDLTLGANSLGTPAEFTDGLVDELVIARRWFRDEEIKAMYLRGLNGLAAVPLPEITVEQPTSVPLVAGVAQVGFGSGLTGTTSQPKSFTIRNAGNADLAVSVSVSGANAADFVVNTTGMASTVAAGGSTTFTVTFTPGAVAARTATLRISSNDEDEAQFDVALSGAGLTALDVVQRGYLKAAFPHGVDVFGGDVAISGDTAVVGVPWDDCSATGVNSVSEGNTSAFRSGAAHVYVRDAAGQWTRQAYLKASNTQSYDYFGSTVAIHGDTIVVGAPGEDSSVGGVNATPDEAFSQLGTSAGAAYVFVRQGGTWSQQAYLKAATPVSQGNFGASLAAGGDVVMVGASNQHAAFVFTRSGGVWSQQQVLTGSNTEQGDYFGHAVVMSGNTAAISAPWEDATGNSGFDCGAAYVFTRPGPGGVWSQQAYLNASTKGQDDYFGWSLALDGDTLAVGAHEEDSSATGVGGTQTDNSAAESGAVYVFTRAGAAWSQQAYVKAGNTGGGDMFGSAVALAGDSLLVGAPMEDSSATWINGNAANESAQDAGAAYLFKRVGTVWSQHAYIKASNTDPGDQFGNAVSLSGDTAIIGAEIEDGAVGGINGNQMSNASADSGAAYLFTGLGPQAPEIRVEQPAGTLLGDSVSTVAFGPVEIGSGGVIRTFTVTNVNTGDLTGLAVAVTGVHAAEFILNTGGMSTTLASGASTTFTVAFSPTALAVRTAVLQITSNDSDESPFDVTLTGAGTGTQSFTFTSGADVAVTANGFTATGNALNLSLGFAPAPYSILTVLNNTGVGAIGGTFMNLAQGQTVTLPFGGTSYFFMADYFGGDGNDLVLRRRDAGLPDLSFKGTGRTTTTFSPGPGNEQANDVVVQPDGKIVAVGTAHTGANDNFALARYTADGEPDSTFGIGGKVTTSLGSQGDEAHAVALQPDGKIVVAGFSVHEGVRKIFVARYLANGGLDGSFGSDGKVTTLIGGANAEGRDVAVQSDGKILVGGDYWAGTDTDFALVRYHANGTLDDAFGSGGIVTTANTDGHDEATCLALQPDGGILLGGYEQAGSNHVRKVARYTTAGALDTTFGEGGLLTTQSGLFNVGKDLAVQADGKILLAGHSPGGGGNDVVVARYNADGTADTTFGTNGIVGLAYGSFGDEAWSILLQPDGKILVGGLTEDGTAEDMLLMRLNSNGALDTSFGLTGKVAASFGLTSHDQAYGMALQPDGHIVLAGVAAVGGNKDFALARYLVETTRTAVFASASTVPFTAGVFSGAGQTMNLTLGFAPAAGTELMLVKNTGFFPIGAEFTNLAHGATVPLTYNSVTYNFIANYSGGTGNDLTLLLPGPGGLDYTFNGSGKAVTAFGGRNAWVQCVAVQGDGKTIVAGHTSNGIDLDFALVRYNANGTLDTSFDGDGRVTTAVGAGDDVAYAVAVQNDGKIVVAGSAFNGGGNDVALVRYHTNGSLDTGFNGSGKVMVPVGSANDVGSAVALQSDGKILVAGHAELGGVASFAVLRFHSDGTPDTAFHGTGMRTTTFPLGASTAQAVAVQTDGKIVVAGNAHNGFNGDFAVARYHADGTPDTSFDGDGMQTTPVGTFDDCRGLALTADGKIVTAGWCFTGTTYEFTLIRYTAAGVPDVSFDGDGKLTTLVDSQDSRAHGMAVQSDGKLVVAGFASTGGGSDFAVARYHPNGTLDTGFDGDGKKTFAMGDGDDYAMGVAIHHDGQIMVAGHVFNGSNYDFAVARLSGDMMLGASFASATDVPLSFNGLDGTGRTLSLALTFAPTPGTRLKVYDNTSLQPAMGEFASLAQGQVVTLTHAATNHSFVANYFGGDGNDLVLEWAGTKLAAFGSNASGQLGITGAATHAAAPAQVVATTPLYQKTILAVSAGQGHSLAVCSDGTVAAWGGNADGQLGRGDRVSATTPVAVSMDGVLSGKKVIAVAAGGQHSLALCSDGTLAAWGDVSFGQLGDGAALDRLTPVLVSTTGALAGKRATAISAGATHSAALCSDGTLVCWGDNTHGELGSGNNVNSNVPVAVSTSGVLAGRSITAIACGQNHTLALLADGTVAAWGLNSSGQLGNNSLTPSNVPVLVGTGGLLNGKRVLRVAAGGHSSLVQTTDGILAAWGLNDRGQLGVNSVTAAFGTPQAVVMSGVLAGKTITRLMAGQGHAAVVCRNGSMAAWGAG
ncbi:MAG: LamG-like jellyroll fold domain-containing protein, partial [Prosthecobacter sp.]